MPRSYNIGILGATGLVGTNFLKILEERNFPIESVRVFASRDSIGKEVHFKNAYLKCEEAKAGAFKGIDILLSSVSSELSREMLPKAVADGAIVIDNSSAFRMDADVPLVVCGVNDEDIKWHKGIIANPNCSTAPLMPILYELNNFAKPIRMIVSTYQSVSGAGKDAMSELKNGGPFIGQQSVFPRPIIHNVIPKIDSFTENGYTKEEVKVQNESRKILHLPDLKVSCTAVRVPVLIGHSESVTVETETEIDFKGFLARLNANPLLKLCEHEDEYPCPIDVVGQDPVFVGRIRKDTAFENGVTFWAVSDNTRIGAALNAVKIAEHVANMIEVKSLGIF